MRILFYLAALTLFAIGCSKESIQIEDDLVYQDQATAREANSDLDYYVENGTLVFKDEATFEEVFSLLSDMEEAEINEWTRSLGLSSLDEKYQEIYTELDGFAEDEQEQFLDYIAANDKYIFMVEEAGGDQAIEQTSEYYLNYFANDDFKFRIGQHVVDLLSDLEVEPSGGRASCTNPIEKTYTVNKSGCKRDRRAKLRGRVVKFVNGPWATSAHWFQNEMRLKGQRKRFCVWFDYRTGHQFFPPVEMVSLHGNQTNDFPFGGSNTCNNCFKINKITNRQIQDFDLTNPIIMKMAYAKGSTTGIGNNTVTIDCE